MKTSNSNNELITKSIFDTAHIIKLKLNAEFEHVGLNGLQARILRFVKINSDNGTDIYQKDIETEFKIRRSSVTSVLNTMEKNGFITRQSVESDARLKKIVLTDKSVTFCKEHHQTITEFDNILKKKFTKDEVDTLILLLNKVVKNIEENEVEI